jgi:hypothetical protein
MQRQEEIINLSRARFQQAAKKRGENETWPGLRNSSESKESRGQNARSKIRQHFQKSR